MAKKKENNVIYIPMLIACDKCNGTEFEIHQIDNQQTMVCLNCQGWQNCKITFSKTKEG